MARDYSVDLEAFSWGVEIECVAPNSAINDDKITIGDYHDAEELPYPFPCGYAAKTDGSIEWPYWFEGTDCEVISPPAYGYDGIPDLRKAVKELKRLGCITNSSCGFHVHVGVAGLLKEFGTSQASGGVAEILRRIVRLMMAHEYELLSVTTPSRYGNTYCKTIDTEWPRYMRYLDQDIPNRDELARYTVSRVDRYHTLNVSNAYNEFNKWTVEFRLFPSILNADLLSGYVQLALALCHKAIVLERIPSVESVNKRRMASRDLPTSEAWLKLRQNLGWFPRGKLFGTLVDYPEAEIKALTRRAKRMMPGRLSETYGEHEMFDSSETDESFIDS